LKKIGRGFGKDLEMHSQELEREREGDPEINSGQVLPKECIKGFV